MPRKKYRLYLQGSTSSGGLMRKVAHVFQNSSLKYSTAEVNMPKHRHLWVAGNRNIAADGHNSQYMFQTDIQGAVILSQNCLGLSHY